MHDNSNDEINRQNVNGPGVVKDSCQSPARQYPLISIVTPSLNQASFIEQAIQSVLSAGYPNLEYIIVDGGSTDGSVEIIRRYSDRLAWWVSESDGGQSEAINKGFGHATGVIGSWVCADDLLLPGALSAVADAYCRKPNAAAWYGNGINIDIEGRKLWEVHAEVLRAADIGVWIPEYSGIVFQPSCFFNLAYYRSIGGVCQDLHNVMDVHLWARLAQRGPFVRINATLSANRDYPATKSNRSPIIRELEHMGMLLKIRRPDLALQRLECDQRLILETMERRIGSRQLARTCADSLSLKTLLWAVISKCRTLLSSRMRSTKRAKQL